ncbi:hypothetical protein BKA70DRAFT_1430146 [Coprinopsis sp. MPI-PUGE-AT-0042]|nr:hypothetical protein BKA70DRAFT_1430146 [Coprinopsis sp. MPI-PUGE-AT-0042]
MLGQLCMRLLKEIDDHPAALAAYDETVSSLKQLGRRRRAGGNWKAQSKAGLAFMAYLESYIKHPDYWKSWSPAGAKEAAELLDIPLHLIARTTNHLESFNSRIKLKYFLPYMHNGRLPRIDYWILILITEVLPDFFDEWADNRGQLAHTFVMQFHIDPLTALPHDPSAGYPCKFSTPDGPKQAAKTWMSAVLGEIVSPWRPEYSAFILKESAKVMAKFEQEMLDVLVDDRPLDEQPEDNPHRITASVDSSAQGIEVGGDDKHAGGADSGELAAEDGGDNLQAAEDGGNLGYINAEDDHDLEYTDAEDGGDLVYPDKNGGDLEYTDAEDGGDLEYTDAEDGGDLVYADENSGDLEYMDAEDGGDLEYTDAEDGGNLEYTDAEDEPDDLSGDLLVQGEGYRSSDDLWILFSDLPDMEEGSPGEANTSLLRSDKPDTSATPPADRTQAELRAGFRDMIRVTNTTASSTSGYSTSPMQTAAHPISSRADFSLVGSVASRSIQDFSDMSLPPSNSTVLANMRTTALMSLQRLEDTFMAGLVEARDAGVTMAELNDMISPSMRRRLVGMGYKDEERPAKRARKEEKS